MTKSAKVYLWHIRDAIATIERYTEDGKDAFLADERTQDAVIYNLAIIGEAVKKLPLGLRAKHREQSPVSATSSFTITPAQR